MSFPNNTCSVLTVLFAFTYPNMKMVKKNANLPMQNMCEFPGLIFFVFLFLCVCVCVRACVRACVGVHSRTCHVCVGGRVHACHVCVCVGSDEKDVE